MPTDTAPRPAINESQWVQYQLDNYTTVHEVSLHASDLRVERAYIGTHYLVCDRTGACGTFEFIGGELTARTGSKLGPHVLTTSSYADSWAYMRGEDAEDMKPINLAGLAEDTQMPWTARLLSAVKFLSYHRFSRLASLIMNRSKYEQLSARDFALRALEKVSVANVLRTQWNIVYDLNTRDVVFRTSAHPSLKKLSLANLDFACSRPSLMADIQQADSGDLAPRLASFSDRENRALVEKNWMIMKAELRNLAEDYPSAHTRCVQPQAPPLKSTRL
jgi:choloylglycine hydrolase